uniref:tRNA modification GTPase GTPBP3, mitochondrial n=2 Tax=Cacopsylla melanoneura TaxID=428564 RepID=A0A8D9A012_9HEMI
MIPPCFRHLVCIKIPLASFKQPLSYWKRNPQFLQCSQSAFKNTIYALSSGHGKCGVAVIRVSGPETFNVLRSMTCHSNLKPPKPRHASLRNIVDPESQVVLDEGVCLWFPKPNSFTGEDCCEFQVHGSLAVVNALLRVLSKQPGLRPAQPGEFSKRAFLNNKLDLTQIEALGDLIHAETELQRQKALGQMKGNLKQLYSEWRRSIIECLASIEAYIDFSEDEIIEDNILNTIRSQVETLSSEIDKHIELSNKCGVRIRSGIKSVIIGEPNVGKSSLMNFLCQKETSIVTPLPGTTRDVIEKHLDIGGYPVLLLDTAGLRSSTSDVIESEDINTRQPTKFIPATIVRQKIPDSNQQDRSSDL